MTSRTLRSSTAPRSAIALLAVALFTASTASGVLAPAAPPPLDLDRVVGIALDTEPTPASAIAAAQALLQERSALLAGPDRAIERSLRDLQAAADVVATADKGGDEVALAVRLAAIASERAGPLPAVPSGPHHALPSGALLALLELNGASTDPESLTAFDALAEPLRDDLALLVDTFIAFEDANIQAASSGSADGVASILSARQGFLEAVAAFQRSVLLSAALPCLGPVAVAPAFSIELGDCPASSYCNPAIDYILLVDMAGNDQYCNNAGGNAGALANCFGLPPAFPAAALIDITGDDQYTPTVNGLANGAPRDCGVNGGGFEGSGILLDVYGDDAYTAGNTGVNGGALSRQHPTTGLGTPSTGLVINVFGNDDYVAGRDGTNGGSSLYATQTSLSSAGLLIDVTGSDTYSAQFGATNGGAWGDVQGEALGALLEVTGDDAYTATDIGVNGGGSNNGAGFLVDLLGNDQYTAGSIGVNGGGGNGNGLLVDGTEDDTYNADFYGVNGGAFSTGSHPDNPTAVGILVDVLGNDRYTADGDGTNGGAEVWGSAGTPSGALGLLVDAQGDDAYTDNIGFGTNGGGHAPAAASAVGTLVDVGFGVDAYNGPLNAAVGQNGAGDGGNGMGLLVDVGGMMGDTYCDQYNGGCAVDATILPPGKSTTGVFGAQLDL